MAIVPVQITMNLGCYVIHCYQIVSVPFPVLNGSQRFQIETPAVSAKSAAKQLYDLGPWAQFHKACKHKNLLSMKFLP